MKYYIRYKFDHWGDIVHDYYVYNQNLQQWMYPVNTNDIKPYSLIKARTGLNIFKTIYDKQNNLTYNIYLEPAL